jgi:hypothetical protein
MITRNGCRQHRDGLESTTFVGRVSAPFTPRRNGEAIGTAACRSTS